MLPKLNEDNRCVSWLYWLTRGPWKLFIHGQILVMCGLSLLNYLVPFRISKYLCCRSQTSCCKLVYFQSGWLYQVSYTYTKRTSSSPRYSCYINVTWYFFILCIQLCIFYLIIKIAIENMYILRIRNKSNKFH